MHKRIISMSVCLILSLAVSAQAIILEGGQLSKAQGEVFLSVKDTLVSVPSNLESALPMPSGSSVWTKKGTAKVSYAGGNIIQLQPNSYCNISEDGMIITQGSVRFEIRSADADTLSVVTPQRISKIEGKGGMAGTIEIGKDGVELITLSEGNVAQASPVDENTRSALDKLTSKISETAGEENISETELLSYILLQAGATGEAKPASPFRPY